MKANELMVGDWVYLEHAEDGIAPYDEPTQWQRDDYDFTDVFIETYIKPIPLTPEILEKNGFVKSHIFVEWKYENNGIYLLWKPFPWLQISTDNADVNFECKYAHELQHALRLCGIEKEIEL